MTRSAAVGRAAFAVALKQPVLGYAANKAQRDQLLAWGATRVWMLGEQAETLTAAVKADRRRGGTLVVCTQGRVFGERRADVMAASKMIEASGLHIHDIEHPAERLNSDALDRALSAVAGSARFRDRRHQNRMARKGGKARAEIFEQRRDAVAARDVIERMLAHPKLTRRDCAGILGISLATLQRNYT